MRFPALAGQVDWGVWSLVETDRPPERVVGHNLGLVDSVRRGAGQEADRSGRAHPRGPHRPSAMGPRPGSRHRRHRGLASMGRRPDRPTNPTRP